MARTVNPVAHMVRREAFLDVAQRLIQTKGYEEMSIQDVLDALETSRGAFYHYFDSKLSLLEAVVNRFAEAAMAAIEPILQDRNLTASRKLERILANVARIKAVQKELVLAIMQVWNSDGNALFREKLRRLTARLLEPILSDVIRQGNQEGAFHTGPADDAARVILYLMQGYQQLALEHFIARQSGAITFSEVRRAHAGLTEAFERLLGAEPGSITLVDESTLRFWFG